MRSDMCYSLLTAMACHITSDKVYDILQRSYLEAFMVEYNRIPVNERPTVLDALLSYTAHEFPILTGTDGSIVYNLSSKKADIVATFLECDMSEMLTQLAARSVMKDMVRQYLKSENKYQTMYSKLNSSRVDAVFVEFLELFRTKCAHAYEFGGSFSKFVMNCFINCYYRGHKYDIWQSLRAVDAARRETEQSVVQEKLLPEDNNGDLRIHDLLLNISLANELLFKHTGQTDETHGVQYDLYYLILCELCQKQVERINADLGENILQFRDPLDRKEYRNGKRTNKGIAIKIMNAKELVPLIFKYVSEGRLSTASISDLRDQCFKVGKHAASEGRNSIWADVDGHGETSHYLDDLSAITNYDNFDIVLKGVVSAYTFMTALERRGTYLVDSYNVDLFSDWNIIRYMDYLSSVEHIDLMRKLQRQPLDYERYSKELYDFEKMIDAYAGSSSNNNANIRENRYWAITHGFLVKPKLKQSNIPTTRFDLLRKVAMSFDAFPRSARDYFYAHASSQTNTAENRVEYHPWATVSAAHIVQSQYQSLMTNIFMVESPERASYYLYNRDNAPLDKLDWSIGTSPCVSVVCEGNLGVYIPLEGAFYYFGNEFNRPCMQTFTELMAEFRASMYNGAMTKQFLLHNEMLPPVGCLANIPNFEAKMAGSLGFSYYIGISNLQQTDVVSRVQNLPVMGQYRQYIVKYLQWMDEVSQLQHSFADVLNIIFTEAFYLLSATAILPDSRRHETIFAQRLLDGLLVSEVDEDALNWVLNKICNAGGCYNIDWSRSDNEYPMDLRVLNYCYNEQGNDTTWPDAWGSVAAQDTPAKRFVSLYNYVYTRAEFLRYLRDAFSLLLDVTPRDSSTLSCELNQKFNVANKMAGFKTANINYGFKTSAMTYKEVSSAIVRHRDRCMRGFRSLLEQLQEFVRESEDEIAKLLEYKISAQDNTPSMFAEWGRLFVHLSFFDVPELRELRSKAGVDSAGFFLYNGSYFKGRNNNTEYYIHRSGRMVYQTATGFEPATFNLEDDTERRLYCDIIRKGFDLLGK